MPMQIDWIAVKDMLPPEPIKPVENLAKIIDGLEEGELEEYLVTIEGAVKATTLYYIGNGAVSYTQQRCIRDRFR